MKCIVLHFYICVLHISAAMHYLHITKLGFATNSLFTYNKFTNGGRVMR